MTERPLRILQVNTNDIRGGAARVSWELSRSYREAGHSSWLAVGVKESDDPSVIPIQNGLYRSLWTRSCIRLERMLSSPFARVIDRKRLKILFRWWLGQPHRYLNIQKGYEDFDFPATWRLLNFLPEKPDVVHLHNLHGEYFDLRALSWLSNQVPVVITLHDAWMLSGHCAHSFGCERWKLGCGACPDLTIYPAIRNDSTAYNWQRKQSIYSRSHFFLATPCDWLMNKAKSSILSAGTIDAKVIHNGVNTQVFCPGNKLSAREQLNIDKHAFVLLFTASGIRDKMWRDFEAMRYAIEEIANRDELERPILFVALGEDAPSERIGNATLRFIPYQKEPHQVAPYFQAADLYLHISRADTFPTAILEALACGTPVIATAVGGIPEQIQDGQNGYLVSPSDSETLADRILHLLLDEDVRNSLGRNAVSIAREKFDLNLQVAQYVLWYRQIMEIWQGGKSR